MRNPAAFVTMPVPPEICRPGHDLPIAEVWMNAWATPWFLVFVVGDMLKDTVTAGWQNGLGSLGKR